MTKIKAVLISDTHSNHAGLKLPDGDLLIHAGDLTGRGQIQAIVSVASWLDCQVHRYPMGVLVIAGNHDLSLDPGHIGYYAPAVDEIKSHSFTWLNNSGITLPNGYKVWGRSEERRVGKEC